MGLKVLVWLLVGIVSLAFCYSSELEDEERRTASPRSKSEYVSEMFQYYVQPPQRRENLFYSSTEGEESKISMNSEQLDDESLLLEQAKYDSMRRVDTPRTLYQTTKPLYRQTRISDSQVSTHTDEPPPYREKKPSKKRVLDPSSDHEDSEHHIFFHMGPPDSHTAQYGFSIPQAPSQKNSWVPKPKSEYHSQAHNSQNRFRSTQSIKPIKEKEVEKEEEKKEQQQPQWKSQQEQPQWKSQQDQPQWKSQQEQPQWKSQQEQPQWNSQQEQPQWNSQQEQPQWNSQQEQPQWNSQQEQPQWKRQHEQPQWNSQQEQPQWKSQQEQSQWKSQQQQSQWKSQQQPQWKSQQQQRQWKSQQLPKVRRKPEKYIAAPEVDKKDLYVASVNSNPVVQNLNLADGKSDDNRYYHHDEISTSNFRSPTTVHKKAIVHQRGPTVSWNSNNFSPSDFSSENAFDDFTSDEPKTLTVEDMNYGRDNREQFHEQGRKGQSSYKFGYNTGDRNNPMARYEEKDADGIVRGSYSFVDANRKLQVVHYESHPEHGFRTRGSLGYHAGGF